MERIKSSTKDRLGETLEQINFELGSWNLELGTWNLKHETWNRSTTGSSSRSRWYFGVTIPLLSQIYLDTWLRLAYSIPPSPVSPPVCLDQIIRLCHCTFVESVQQDFDSFKNLFLCTGLTKVNVFLSNFNLFKNLNFFSFQSAPMHCKMHFTDNF